MEEKDFEENEYCYVLGKLKNPMKLTDSLKRIGGFRVWLLRKFLEKLSEEGEESIGVYVTKRGELAPVHCKGFMLAPLGTDKFVKEQDEDEFRPKDLKKKSAKKQKRKTKFKPKRSKTKSFKW